MLGAHSMPIQTGACRQVQRGGYGEKIQVTKGRRRPAAARAKEISQGAATGHIPGERGES